MLAAADSDAVTGISAFISKCLNTGKLELLQGRVFSAVSVSNTLYESGWNLAEYRGLLGAGMAEERREFHDEFRNMKRQLDEILAITTAQADQL